MSGLSSFKSSIVRVLLIYFDFFIFSFLQVVAAWRFSETFKGYILVLGHISAWLIFTFGASSLII